MLVLFHCVLDPPLRKVSRLGGVDGDRDPVFVKLKLGRQDRLQIDGRLRLEWRRHSRCSMVVSNRALVLHHFSLHRFLSVHRLRAQRPIRQDD